MNNETLIPFKNEVFKLIKRMPEHGLSEQFDLPFWENKLNTDLVLKKDGFLFFCQLVNQAEIISEYVSEGIKFYETEKLKTEKNINLFINI